MLKGQAINSEWRKGKGEKDMLAINILRINGYDTNKRSHIDLEVELTEVYSGDKMVLVPNIPYISMLSQIAYEGVLIATTSYNYYDIEIGKRVSRTYRTKMVNN